MQLGIAAPIRHELLLHSMNCFSKHIAERQIGRGFGWFAQDMSHSTHLCCQHDPICVRKEVAIDVANPKASKHRLVRNDVVTAIMN
jgi:hypothetical protein